MPMHATRNPDIRRRRRDELVRQAWRAHDVAELFAEASTRLRRLVHFDAAAWLSTDPGTGLPTAPTRVENLGDPDPDQCSRLWRREFLADDVNRFRDIARADVPAASLRAAAPDPTRSARYREFLRPLGLADELRAVLRVGDSPWGMVGLLRRAGRPQFTADETRFVAGLSAPLGEALRACATLPAESLGRLVRPDQPGLLVFDRAASLISVNEKARAWLAELPHDECLPSGLGVDVPMWIITAVLQAGAVAGGYGDGTARSRLRTRRGQWLVCHASCLRDADGGVGSVAVVVEPAKATDIAPIIVEAYGLSDREQQITRLIAWGAATAEIAAELHLSAHTVRDYVKAIFAKVGVSARGELVAKLFAEYYEPMHQGDVRVVAD